MPLYSLRSDASGDTISKFDVDGNIEAYYRVVPGRPGHCDCPAGQRPTCRHRQMLPFLRGYANTQWFLDWDNGRRIVDFQGTPKSFYDQCEAAGVPAEDMSDAEAIIDLFDPAATLPPANPSEPTSATTVPSASRTSWRRM